MSESNALIWFYLCATSAKPPQLNGKCFTEALRQMGLSPGRFARKAKVTRQREFADETKQALPCAKLPGLVPPKASQPGPKGGLPPLAGGLRGASVARWQFSTGCRNRQCLDGAQSPLERPLAAAA